VVDGAAVQDVDGGPLWPIEQIEADSERDRWFSAEEAKHYGFIDEVIAKRPPSARPPLTDRPQQLTARCDREREMPVVAGALPAAEDRRR
jgi:hypothetical protein